MNTKPDKTAEAIADLNEHEIILLSLQRTIADLTHGKPIRTSAQQVTLDRTIQTYNALIDARILIIDNN